jgi:putative zinc finger/helix-turn-helix YgiT family protein
MKKMLVCEKCNVIDEAETKVVRVNETYKVKGEEIETVSSVRICERCGSDVFDEVLDSANLQRAYDIYRQMHHILSPDDIRSIREEYGLTQRSLSALLGLGEITIHRYENGSLPDEAHNLLLRFLLNPTNVQLLFEQNGNRIPMAAQRRLRDRLQAVTNQNTANALSPT